MQPTPMYRSPARRLTLLITLCLLLPASVADSQTADFPVEPGEAVATCFAGFEAAFDPESGIAADAPVVAAIDVRNPEANGAIPGKHWFAPMFHNETHLNSTNNPNDEWTAKNLGQVFGIALDDRQPPSIFVAAATVYSVLLQQDGSFAPHMFGPLGPGGVYRLDGLTGAICPFAQLPNSGPGLGNIAYDREHGQLLVTNFEDGLIYRLPASSPCGVKVQPIGTAFDHGTEGRPAAGLPAVADDGLSFDPATALVGATTPSQFVQSCSRAASQSGFTQLGRRVWGLQVNEGRLYYSVWNEDQTRRDVQLANEIWSVGLLPSGDFDRSDVRRELELPAYGNSTASNPVSDIAFSGDGRMLVAERVRCRDFGVAGSNAHSARVLEYEPDGSGAFVMPPQRVAVGRFSANNNSAGGVDYGFGYEDSDGDGTIDAVPCDETYWATGDALRLSFPDSPRGVYGLQGTPRRSYQDDLEQLESSYFIDLDSTTDDPNFGTQDKTDIGDVEIARNDCIAPPCLDELTIQALCDVDDTGQSTGAFLWRFRVTNRTEDPVHHLFLVDLPSNVMAEPDHFVFDPPLRPGSSRIVGPVELTGATPGDVLGLRVSIHDETLAECCAETVTVELPDCVCAQLTTERRPACFDGPRFLTPPPYRYYFDLQNLTQSAVDYIFATAVEPGDLTTPIPSEDLSVSVPGVLDASLAPGEISDRQRVLISGPRAQPGAPVCLRLSTHDRGFAECCSTVRCFELPDCFLDVDDFSDFDVHPFGDAMIAFDAGRFVVSGFDDEDDSGVIVGIGGADGVALAWDSLDQGKNAGTGSQVRVAATSRRESNESEDLGTLLAARLGRTVALTVSLGSPGLTLRVELLDDGEIVATTEGVSSEVIAELDDWPRAAVFRSGPESSELLVSTDGDRLVELADGRFASGDQLRIRLLQPRQLPTIDQIALSAAGIETIRIDALVPLFDCNGNGIQDEEEIADGSSEDADGDGVPDQCQATQQP